jgi:cytochrome P450
MQRARAPELHELMQHNLFTMQPPHHGPGRQLVSRRLTTKSVARFASRMQALVEARIDKAAERDDVDFRRDIAAPVMVGFWQVALGWSEDEATEACTPAARSQLSNLLRPTPDQRRAVNQASLDLIRLRAAESGDDDVGGRACSSPADAHRHVVHVSVQQRDGKSYPNQRSTSNMIMERT